MILSANKDITKKRELGFFVAEEIIKKYLTKKNRIEDAETMVEDCESELMVFDGRFGKLEDRIKFLETNINSNLFVWESLKSSVRKYLKKSNELK